MNSKHTFIDLFAGCGGLSEGFYKQGFLPLSHVDHDYFSCKTLTIRLKHYGFNERKVNILKSDIKEIIAIYH